MKKKYEFFEFTEQFKISTDLLNNDAPNEVSSDMDKLFKNEEQLSQYKNKLSIQSSLFMVKDKNNIFFFFSVNNGLPQGDKKNLQLNLKSPILQIVLYNKEQADESVIISAGDSIDNINVNQLQMSEIMHGMNYSQLNYIKNAVKIIPLSNNYTLVLHQNTQKFKDGGLKLWKDFKYKIYNYNNYKNFTFNYQYKKIIGLNKTDQKYNFEIYSLDIDKLNIDDKDTQNKINENLKSIFAVDLNDYIKENKKMKIYIYLETFANIICFLAKNSENYILGIFYIDFNNNKCLNYSQIKYDNKNEFLLRINRKFNEIYLFNLNNNLLYIYNFYNKNNNTTNIFNENDRKEYKINFDIKIKGMDFTEEGGLIVLTEKNALISFHRFENEYKNYKQVINNEELDKVKVNLEKNEFKNSKKENEEEKIIENEKESEINSIKEKIYENESVTEQEKKIEIKTPIKSEIKEEIKQKNDSIKNSNELNEQITNNDIKQNNDIKNQKNSINTNNNEIENKNEIKNDNLKIQSIKYKSLLNEKISIKKELSGKEEENKNSSISIYNLGNHLKFDINSLKKYYESIIYFRESQNKLKTKLITTHNIITVINSLISDYKKNILDLEKNKFKDLSKSKLNELYENTKNIFDSNKNNSISNENSLDFTKIEFKLFQMKNFLIGAQYKINELIDSQKNIQIIKELVTENQKNNKFLINNQNYDSLDLINKIKPYEKIQQIEKMLFKLHIIEEQIKCKSFIDGYNNNFNEKIKNIIIDIVNTVKSFTEFYKFQKIEGLEKKFINEIFKSFFGLCFDLITDLKLKFQELESKVNDTKNITDEDIHIFCKDRYYDKYKINDNKNIMQNFENKFMELYETNNFETMKGNIISTNYIEVNFDEDDSNN